MYFVVDYTLLMVLIGSALLGATTGAVGVFAFLRKQSLLGDALSHASLPGIAIAFLITGSRNVFFLLVGGACSGVLGAGTVLYIMHATRIKKEAALGIVLSVFFGCGIMLLSAIQKYPNAQQSIINKFLYGNVSTLIKEDIIVISILSITILACLLLFFKQFQAINFDKSLSKLCGYPTVFYEVFLILLLVLAIIIGLQTVGVILMSALLIAPAAAARQWVYRLHSLICLSAFFGMFSCVVGTILSYYLRMPTGPLIIIVVSSMVVFSLVLAQKMNRYLLRKFF